MGLLASLEPLDLPDTSTLKLRIAQGVEMGRPSLLLGEATHSPPAAGGSGAEGRRVVGKVRVGGACVPIMRGEICAAAVQALTASRPP
eukprot:COSAG04_NODE_586_length_12338_cov_16.547839_11_plen_88_part_00